MRWQRWAVGVVLGGLVVASVGQGVVASLRRKEHDRLQGQWAQVQAFDVARLGADIKLDTLINQGFDDGTIAYPALGATCDMESADLRRVDRLVAHDLLIDGGLRRLRRLMRAAVAVRLRDLGALSSYYHHPEGARLPITGGDFAAAESEVGRRLGTQAAAAPTVHYAPADAAVARLSRWSDQPLGISLLANTRLGPSRLDIDASRATVLPGTPDTVIARRGFTAYDINGTVRAGPASLALDPAHDPVIGHVDEADYLWAADRPDAVWIASGTVLSEVDGSGHVLAGPAPRASGVSGISVAAGPVLEGGKGLEVWAPGRIVCRLPDRSFPIAGRGDVLAWIDLTNEALVVSQVSRCDRRQIRLPAETIVAPGYLRSPGAISPDQTTLATVVLESTRSDLLLVNLATGQTQVWTPLDTVAPDVNFAWTSDSKRLFFNWARPGGEGQLWTGRLGDPAPSPLRLLDVGSGTTGLQVVP